MTERQILLVQALAVVFLLGGGTLTSQAATESPNVIIVMTDDQGYGDVGVHGNDKVKTPNLDRFAQEGVQLRHFYCSPVCAPTRASLLTGRYFYRTGVIHTSRGGAKMHGDEVTLAEMLKEAGYATGIFGKWHLGDNYPTRPIDQGFDELLIHKSGAIGQTPDCPNDYFDPLLWRNGREFRATGYCTDVFFGAATEFIEANRDRPFFVYLPTNAPHTPLTVDERYVKPYRAMGLDDTTARVYGMVQNIDENFGRLLKTLDRLHLRRNTLLIFLTDNGPQQRRYNAGLKGRKASVYEGGIRVPCFVQWPGAFRGSARIDRIAAHIDIVPTVLAACGVKTPNDVSLDGVNLIPLLRGETENWPDRALFFQVHRGLSPQRYHNAAVRTPRYKLLFSPTTFGKERIELPADPPSELYDLHADPGEQNNLAEEHAEVVASLRERYDAWFEDVESTRNFTPGAIHIGSDRDNPTVLCRYQDSAYVDGQPTTWSVVIETAGLYELTVDRGEETDATEMYVHVSVNGAVDCQPLAKGTSSVVDWLPAGPAELDIWVQRLGAERKRITDNSTRGNVRVRYIPLKIVPPPVTSIIDQKMSFLGLRFSADGHRIWTRSLRSWNVSTGKQLNTEKTRAAIKEEDFVAAMDLSQDGRRMIAAEHWSGTIGIWHVQSQEIQRLIRPMEAEPSTVQFLGGDGKYGVWYRDPPSVVIGNVNSDREQRFLRLRLGGEPGPGAFAPNGRFFAVSSPKQGRVALWDLGQEDEKYVLRHDRVMSLDFSPDGSQLATGGGDNVIRLWDVAKGAEMAALNGHGKGDILLPIGVYSLAFSPRGNLLASGGHDGRINVWDLETQKVTFEAQIGARHRRPMVLSVAFSPDSRLLAAGFMGPRSRGGLCIWRLDGNDEKDQ